MLLFLGIEVDSSNCIFLTEVKQTYNIERKDKEEVNVVEFDVEQQESEDLPQHCSNVGLGEVVLAAQHLVADLEVAAHSARYHRRGSDFEVVGWGLQQSLKHISMQVGIKRTAVEH